MDHDGAVTTMEGERFEPDGYVYVLAGGGYYKIGRTRSLNLRRAQLETQLPFRATLLHAFPCMDVVEAESTLHRRFADVRVNGEWFVLEPNDLEILGKIRRMRGGDIEFGEVVPVREFERTVRITVDASREQHRRLKIFAMDAETDAMSVMRALLDELDSNPALAARIMDRLYEDA